MITPEQNDVNLTKLFNWGKEFEVNGLSGDKQTVYIRLIGDSELNRARVWALRDSAKLRKRLHDPESDEALAFIPDPDLVDKENLVETLLGLMVTDMTREIIKEVRIPFPKEPPSDAKQEVLEKYQEEVDAYPEKRYEKIKEELEKRIEKERKVLSRKTVDTLVDLYTSETINSLCSNEMDEKFLSYSTYFGTYKDENFTERLFKDIEEFMNLPPDVKKELIDKYMSLGVDIQNLKK